MKGRSRFRILAGVDDSTQAHAALATLLRGPWPDDALVRVVAASRISGTHQRSLLLSALDARADDAAERGRRVLAERWADAEAVVVRATPGEAILEQAAAFRPDVIAVGWRGHGAARSLLMGSVSRQVVRGATSSVLVVRRAPARLRRIVIAFDGSAHAGRAVELVARLTPPRDGRVTLVHAVQLLLPTSGAPPIGGLRTSIAGELKRINTARSREAAQALKRAAQQLARAGWRTRTELGEGDPLRALLQAARSSGADLIVVGARGTAGIRRLMLGSVAEGILARSQVPVLLAR